MNGYPMTEAERMNAIYEARFSPAERARIEAQTGGRAQPAVPPGPTEQRERQRVARQAGERDRSPEARAARAAEREQRKRSDDSLALLGDAEAQDRQLRQADRRAAGHNAKVVAERRKPDDFTAALLGLDEAGQ